jgi:kinesin family member 11
MSEKLRSSSPTTKGLQQTGTGGTNINVAIRCRPTTTEESRQSQSAALVCDTDNKSLTLSFGPPGKKTAKNYAFEKCFDAQATQEDIFESVARPVVNEALAGYNCTIFAYGQTGITNRTFFINHHSILLSPKVFIAEYCDQELARLTQWRETSILRKWLVSFQDL